MESSASSNAALQQVASSGPDAQVKLTQVAITDQNVALNVMVSFLNLAQKRGSFTIDESAKIYECIKKFS